MVKAADLESNLILEAAKVVTDQSENKSCFKTLSFKERIYAFLFFNFLGYVLQMGSIFQFVGTIVKADSAGFALLYSFGNVLSTIGTLFIVGVKEQIEMASSPTRKLCSIVYFGSIMLSILFALILSGFFGNILIVAAVFTQMLSYWWYLFSYVPGARNLICGCFSCFRKFIRK